MHKRSSAVLMIVAGGACAGALWVSQSLGDVIHRSPRLWSSAPASALIYARADEQEEAAIPSTFSRRTSGFWASVRTGRSSAPSPDRVGAPLATMPPMAVTQQTYSMSAPVFLSDPATAQARSIAVGDVSGDGRDDIVFLSLVYAPNPANNRMEIYAIYQGDDGHLDAAVKIGESGNNLAYQLLIADLDGDGVGDIITSTGTGIMILRLNADGTFASKTTAAGDPYDIVATDVDRDGYLDVLVDSSDMSATVIHGDGHGAFDRVSTLPLPSAAARTTGDVTGDGLDDLILGTIFNRPLEEFRIYPAMARGGYASPIVLSLPLGSNPTASLVVGDFNSDGRGDLVLDEARNSANLRLYLQNGQGNLAPSIEIARYSSSGPLIATDLDGDGRTDLATAHTGWSYIGYYLQTNYGLAPEVLINAYQRMGRKDYFAAGDLNQDGCVDLAIARWSQSPVILYGQGCAPPRVVACCSQPILMEGPTPSATRPALPLVRPINQVGDNGGGDLVRGAGPRPGRNERGTPDFLHKRAHVPVLTP